VLAGAAALLWFRLNTYEADFLVSVKLENMPTGLTVVGDWPKKIEAKIRGPKSKINLLVQNNNLSYSVDLSEAKQPINTIKINPDHFSFPGEISIESINPSFLTVKMDEEVKKGLAIKVAFSGKPAKGFVIADVVTDPGEVILSGPQSVVKALQSVETKPIDVTDAQKSIRKEVLLDLPENTSLIFPDKHILVSIFIEENIVERKINEIMVMGKDAQWPYRIIPPTISLEMKGHELDLERFAQKGDDDLAVFVDLKGLTPGVYIRNATILLPGNVTLLGVEPTIFTVKIEKK